MFDVWCSKDLISGLRDYLPLRIVCRTNPALVLRFLVTGVADPSVEDIKGEG